MALDLDVIVEAEEDISAWIDTGRVERVLINLLNNAASAGATKVRISVFPAYGRTLPRDQATDAVIDVADDGLGFDPNLLPRAFERFARARRPAHRLGRAFGTGLGLAIVAALVDAHGGTVTADNGSALGGARIQVRLPS